MTKHEWRRFARSISDFEFRISFVIRISSFYLRHLDPNFFQRIHVHLKFYTRFEIEPVTDAFPVHDLSDRNPFRKDAADAAGDHTLARSKFAVAGDVTQI